MAQRAPLFAAEGCNSPEELDKSSPKGGNFSSYIFKLGDIHYSEMTIYIMVIELLVINSLVIHYQ